MLVVIGVRKQQLSIKYSRISRCRFVTKALIRKTELLSHRPKKPQQLSPTHTLNNNNENIGIEIDFSQHPSTRGCFYFYLFVIPWNQSGFGKHRIWDHWLMLTHTIRSSIVTIENQFFDKKTQKKKYIKSDRSDRQQQPAAVVSACEFYAQWMHSCDAMRYIYL